VLHRIRIVRFRSFSCSLFDKGGFYKIQFDFYGIFVFVCPLLPLVPLQHHRITATTRKRKLENEEDAVIRTSSLTTRKPKAKRLVGGRELGDGLGALRDGVLGELTGEHEPDRGLDLPGRKSRLLVVLGELSGLSGDALEDVVDEGVHDGHALLGDAGVGVDLLQHLVDVRRVGLDPLGALALGSGLLGGLGGFLGRCLSHFEDCGCDERWVGEEGRLVSNGNGCGGLKRGSIETSSSIGKQHLYIVVLSVVDKKWMMVEHRPSSVDIKYPFINNVSR
jgi:hypothetical protein